MQRQEPRLVHRRFGIWTMGLNPCEFSISSMHCRSWLVVLDWLKVRHTKHHSTRHPCPAHNVGPHGAAFCDLTNPPDWHGMRRSCCFSQDQQPILTVIQYSFSAFGNLTSVKQELSNIQMLLAIFVTTWQQALSDSYNGFLVSNLDGCRPWV